MVQLTSILGALVPLYVSSLVLAHGVVTSPTPRKIGTANQAACGTAVYTKLKSDLLGPIESSAAKIDSSYNATACHLYLCRGYQIADNTANVHVFAPGTVVPITIDLAAHHTGHANVSIVNLATQKLVGSPLINWPVYANDTLGPSAWPKNETDFSVTIPSTLGTQCTTAGSCAIQWWWYAPGQTFESCIDFTTV